MLLYVFVLLFLPINLGFLLDGSTPLPPNGQSAQYLTLSTFYDQKQQIDYRIDQVQRDHDNKLGILASQIQQKFAALEARLGNSTSGVPNGLDLQFQELEKNNTNLNNELISLENKYTTLISALDSIQNLTESKHEIAEVELENLKNKTLELVQQFSGLSQFKDFNGLQDYLSLQEKVRSIDANVQRLMQSEVTRSREFLSLYNQTLTTKKVLEDVNSRIARKLKDLQQTAAATNRHIQSLETNLENSKTELNGSFSSIGRNLSEAVEPVSMTAFLHSYNSYYRPNLPLKFTGTNYNYGVKDSTLIQTNGTFTCEKGGLYLISVSMTSYSSGTKYNIHYNGTPISVTYIGVYDGPSEHTASSSVVWELKENDKIWIQLTNDNPRRNSINLYGNLFSRLSIVKLK